MLLKHVQATEKPSCENLPIEPFEIKKTPTISKFQFHLDTVDEESPCGCATAKTAYSHEFPFTYYLYSLYGRVIVSISPYREGSK